MMIFLIMYPDYHKLKNSVKESWYLWQCVGLCVSEVCSDLFAQCLSHYNLST